jgi:hypothetical protein
MRWFFHCSKRFSLPVFVKMSAKCLKFCTHKLFSKHWNRWLQCFPKKAEISEWSSLFCIKSYLVLCAKAMFMSTAHFLTERFKQLGAKGPGFSVVYCFYGFIHHIFQAYFHHLKWVDISGACSDWSSKMIPKLWYGYHPCYISEYCSCSSCTHIDIFLPSDFMFFHVGIHDNTYVFICNMAFKELQHR